MQENPTTAVTIAELEQRSLEVAEAESRALRALADHLREAAVQLPRDSTMGMHFAKHGRAVESTASFVDRPHRRGGHACPTDLHAGDRP